MSSLGSPQNKLLSSFLWPAEYEGWLFIFWVMPKSVLSSSFLIFGDYQASTDNAGQTREISLSTGAVWSCTEVHAQHIHTGIHMQRAASVLYWCAVHNIFSSWLLILWYLQCEDLKDTFSSVQSGQDWSGSPHWINCLVCPTIVYYTIFPNKIKITKTNEKVIEKKSVECLFVFSPQCFYSTLLHL